MRMVASVSTDAPFIPRDLVARLQRGARRRAGSTRCGGVLARSASSRHRALADRGGGQRLPARFGARRPQGRDDGRSARRRFRDISGCGRGRARDRSVLQHQYAGRACVGRDPRRRGARASSSWAWPDGRIPARRHWLRGWSRILWRAGSVFRPSSIRITTFRRMRWARTATGIRIGGRA